MPGFAHCCPDERDQLLAELAAQRHLLAVACFGLTDEQGRRAPSASALSLGGIVKHLARTETFWLDLVAGRHLPFDPSADHEEGFRVGPDETLRGVLGSYREVAAETERVVRSLPVDHPVPVPSDVPWFPSGLEAWNLRWVLLHLVAETARHAGHADIVRESIDGATWIPLMAAAEHWAPVPWATPWQPSVGPAIRLGSVSLDCPDPRALAAFYARLLSVHVGFESDEFAALRRDGLWISFQRVEPFHRPTWPDGEVPQQVHLDFAVTDLDEAEAAAMASGAAKAATQPSPERWRVLFDPAGHPFCLTALIPD